MPPSDELANRKCPACGSAMPAASFCGDCGARLDAPIDTWTQLLRPKVFANAHREAIWVPRVSSGLFPRIAGETRRPYRIGLITVLIAVVLLSAARLNGPLGVMAIIGWPLLFLIYVWETDVFRDLPARILVTAMLLGAGLGVGAWLTTGKVIAGSYGVTTGSGLLLLGNELQIGFLISLGGAALMLVPALVTRLFKVPVRESLDGFVVGAFGALWYSTAATTTILAPQFAEGLQEDQDAGRLLGDSITYGIASAVVTTAVGGVVGLLLWFRVREGGDPRRPRAALAICAALAVGCYLAVWFVDALGLPLFADMAAKLALAVLALIVVRSAVQIALLHEEPDPASGDPILCVHCERIVPDRPFCVACGAAARASSRASRRLRHEFPPIRQESSS
jgi:hypothetical protein